jgi:energy-coupling factor transporter ATP-binding protein EcfA2
VPRRPARATHPRRAHGRLRGRRSGGHRRGPRAPASRRWRAACSASGRTPKARCCSTAPIEEWSREELGPHLGYLPQDIELFDGTIAENIARFGRRSPAAAAIIEAAKRTGIHEMILRLPEGYDTRSGEAGSMLSGGQRQRIGLARAIIGDRRWWCSTSPTPTSTTPARPP